MQKQGPSSTKQEDENKEGSQGYGSPKSQTEQQLASHPTEFFSKSVIPMPITKKAPSKTKKAPDAPKRFKSAFIFFSADKHKEIRAQLEEEAVPEKTSNISKLVSKAWKSLSPEEKDKWETLARNDRSRYEMEKTLYKGPWQVPNKRKIKDANAPKRPMSAFLAFANSRRAMVKQQMPTATNGDVSRTLAAMWKDAPDDVRQIYIDEEYEKRQQYKGTISEWRKEDEEKKRKERQQREATALRLSENVRGAESSVYHNPPASIGYESYCDFESDVAVSNEVALQPINSHLSSSFYPHYASYEAQGGGFYGAFPVYDQQYVASRLDHTNYLWTTDGPHQPQPSTSYKTEIVQSQQPILLYSSPSLHQDSEDVLQPMYHPSSSVHRAVGPFVHPYHETGVDPLENQYFNGSLSSDHAPPHSLTSQFDTPGIYPHWYHYHPGTVHQHPAVGYTSHTSGTRFVDNNTDESHDSSLSIYPFSRRDRSSPR